jgi:hypothetical protein
MKLILILILTLLPACAAAGKFSPQTCTTSTFSGTTTTKCSNPRLVCKSSTFAGVTRTVCSK